MPLTPRERLRIYFGRAPRPSEPDLPVGLGPTLLAGLLAGVIFAGAWGAIAGDWGVAVVVGVAFAVGSVLLGAVGRRRRR